MPRLFGDIRKELHLAELVRVLSQLAEDVVALLSRCRWEVVVGDSDYT